ncbi:MAG: hypothetical protein R2797_04090 [Gelidibacter sp.]
MGGEGAMMAMITSLKNNGRRHKRIQFDKDKVGGYGNSEKVEFDFPKATPQMLQQIREKLQKERRRRFYRQVAVLTIILIVLIVIYIK